MSYEERIESLFKEEYVGYALNDLSGSDKKYLEQDVSINPEKAKEKLMEVEDEPLLGRIESAMPGVELYKSLLETERKSLTKTLLNKGEYYTKIVESMGQEPSQEFKDRVAALWAKFGQTKTQIASLSTVEEAKSFEFPMDDINDALNFFESLI